MSHKSYKLSDQVIGQVRELLQFSMLTNTSIVDHLRALTLEENKKTKGILILSEDYVKGWNEMGDKFYHEAEKKMQEMQKEADPEESPSTSVESLN